MSTPRRDTERLLSIPIEPAVDDLLGKAARRVHRSKAAFVRWVVMCEMQRMGMMNASLEALPESAWPALANRTEPIPFAESQQNPHG